ncbi:spermatogenesis-associated protein 17 [Rhopalosiphum maidis]|uniref:spermatogenesis-associated protein 17 n=1 Tax=Rhopalosiphum maidis TaxID=43146 RepID=UPI000EFEA490|nr:spermatogenesis-associated protein 17 [Rhopalosiphum maidis]
MVFIENITRIERGIDNILQLKQRNGTRIIEGNKTAAITIQRHFRGYYTRLYFSKLNVAAKVIQKHWKGYITRRYFNNLLIKTFVCKSIDYYNKAATIIQKYYKGYYIRKYYLDIKKNTKWIKEIQKQNDAWSNIMNDYNQNICNHLEIIHKEKIKCLIIKMVYKHHPMLRTILRKGVFSGKTNSDSEFEKLVRNIYAQINKKSLKI